MDGHRNLRRRPAAEIVVNRVIERIGRRLAAQEGIESSRRIVTQGSVGVDVDEILMSIVNGDDAQRRLLGIAVVVDDMQPNLCIGVGYTDIRIGNGRIVTADDRDRDRRRALVSRPGRSACR